MSDSRQPPPGQPGLPRVMPVGLPKTAPIGAPRISPMVPPRMAPPPPPHVAPANPHPPATATKVVAMQGHKPTDDELAPIGLIEEAEDGTPDKKIQAFGMTSNVQHHDWKRQPVKTGTGAVRVRSFHGRLSDQGLGYIDEAINEWLDQHPEIEIKFVTSTVGVFEGKIREPALVMNLWY